ncbi:MAG: DNA methyltransferase, partial [Methanocorpusculum sp.]|nr:DNA methyltransferase [Methanocorpusculum sp.]
MQTMTQNTAEKIRSKQDFDAYLRSFHLTQDTEIAETETSGVHVTKYINEFWTAKQRDANRLHEVSYRACFKPQLPRFFIDALTLTGDRVYDPFGGRGTTVVEAVLAKRCGI